MRAMGMRGATPYSAVSLPQYEVFAIALANASMSPSSGSLGKLTLTILGCAMTVPPLRTCGNEGAKAGNGAIPPAPVVVDVPPAELEDEDAVVLAAVDVVPFSVEVPHA